MYLLGRIHTAASCTHKLCNGALASSVFLSTHSCKHTYTARDIEGWADQDIACSLENMMTVGAFVSVGSGWDSYVV